MKQLLSVFALAALGTACQPQTTATPPPAQAAPATGAAPVAVVNHSTGPAAAPVPEPKDAQAAALLKRYDLAAVLQTVSAEPGQMQAMNGFYGPDHYRMEMVLTKVMRDPAHYNRYLVQGQDRYKGTITNLSGTIDLTQVWQRTDKMADGTGRQKPVTIYSALGSYELHEDPTAKGAGVFRGKIAADMALDDKRAMTESPTYDSPSKGGGITYDGNWTSLTTGQQKAATWVVNLFEYQGPAIASDFKLGERDPQINPKYAKLGWNTYWENDEWWAKTPQPTASM